MSLPMSRDFALYAVAKPDRQAAQRWPRMACLAAALVVSLGLWVVLIRETARLLGF